MPSVPARPEYIIVPSRVRASKLAPGTPLYGIDLDRIASLRATNGAVNVPQYRWDNIGQDVTFDFFEIDHGDLRK